MLTEYVKFLDNVLVNAKFIGDVYGEVTGFGKTYLAIKVDDYTVINIQHRDINKIVKANPSLVDPSFSTLRQRIQQEITKMPFTPEYFQEFMAKRCDYPISDPQMAVAEWNDIVECTKEQTFQLTPGMSCVGGVDYTKTNDF